MQSNATAPQTYIDAVDQVLDRVKSLGLRVHTASRIGRMHKVLQRGVVEFDDPEYLLALEARRDLYQLELIFEELEAQRDQPEFVQNVKLMLADAALPQDDSDNTPGRDYQFQLYLAAVCLRGGNGIVHGEPDVRCLIDGTTFGIAAKRLKSNRGIEKHFRKGVNQIRGAGVYGIVAMDLTMARSRKNVPMVSPLWNQMREVIRVAKNNQFGNAYVDKFTKLACGSGTLAVVTFEFVLRLNDKQKWVNEGSMAWFATTEDLARLSQFQKSFLSGMPALIHETEQES